MRRAACLIAALLAVACPARGEEARPQAAKPWWALVPDTYDGAIFSGQGYLKGATEFRREGQGLVGHYAFVETDGRQVEGTLTACLAPAPNNLACRWRDLYGEGTVVFVFEDSLQSFAGLWFSKETPKQGMPWSGKRRLGS